jgi:hypothetical protein
MSEGRGVRGEIRRTVALGFEITDWASDADTHDLPISCRSLADHVGVSVIVALEGVSSCFSVLTLHQERVPLS